MVKNWPSDLGTHEKEKRMKLQKSMAWTGFMAMVLMASAGLWGCDNGAPVEPPQDRPMENSGTDNGSADEGSDNKPAEGSQAK